MDSRPRRLSWLWTLLLLTGCSELFGGAEPCTEPVLSLNVSAGLTPTFTWSPDCHARMLMIEHYTAGSTTEFLWSVGSPKNELESGVRYGTVPKRNTASGPAPPLLAGESYKVELWADAEGGHPLGLPLFITTFDR